MNPAIQIALVIFFLSAAMGLCTDYRWSWPLFWLRVIFMATIAALAILVFEAADLFKGTFNRHD